jgi:hypothetical protein
MVDDFYGVNRFVGGTAETNIYKLDQYKSGAAAVTPWSSSYWPYYDGGIGVRYGDNRFPHSSTFMENYRYYEKNYSQNPTTIRNLDTLSPAEKYDLLVNDKDWTLTYNSWALGRRHYQLSGEVEKWMGICHGWAPAAIMIPEPNTTFSINLPNLGKSMKIYPDDVKALVAQQWAAARVQSFLIGGRCEDTNPATDANGRLISKQCFDTNPGAWHLVLLNWMGKSGQSFVFDATYDYQVWNQPVSSYSLSYFNPYTRVSSNSLDQAIIPYSSYNNDPYRAYRSPAVKSIVGVELKLSYVVESMPHQYEGTTIVTPPQVEVTYFYDLELDANNNIIGGEWYQRAHPDMMWRPTVKRPLVVGEAAYSYWNGLLPIPMDLSSFAKSSAKINQPVNAILDYLISWSQNR